MPTLALASATANFGLTLLRTFLHLNALTPTHTLILLSRTPQPQLSEVDPNLTVRIVDYTDLDQLTHALRDVHTLLSLIGGAGLRYSQLALIAAAKSAGVKRFAPSEFAGHGYEGIDLYAGKAEVWEAAKASGMEVTKFETGLFMSVLATGTPKESTEVGVREGAKSGEEEALAGLRPWKFVIDAEAGTADLPGDGRAKLVWTDMRDVARFVWEACALEEWDEVSGMRGDVKSFREVVEILERVQGRKFLIKGNPLDKLEKEAEEPGMRFYNQCRIAFAKGWGMVGDDLNRAFPDVKATTCEEFIGKWWGGVALGEPQWVDVKAFDAEDM
ncbi:unnamed protein product [Zymoseptoria tritici ST99CH_1E4]|uniref:NmrA-like domain-containing protein n=1 Tax=Zymoseptoria tritici ST99CH_1E4 TaxID=1276532 RepID=A0A2H1FYG5_ZYMTR|nr:unnamed protein product [Zymoseptoria tritici ST99CH_1E4]